MSDTLVYGTFFKGISDQDTISRLRAFSRVNIADVTVAGDLMDVAGPVHCLIADNG